MKALVNAMGYLGDRTANELAAITVLLTVAIAGAWVLYKTCKGQWANTGKELICILIPFLSISTSFGHLFEPGDIIHTGKWDVELSPSLAFLVIVFIKVLLSFWVFHMLYTLKNSERVAESRIKVFGVEMSNTLSLDVKRASEGVDRLSQQMRFLDTLNAELLHFYVAAFDQQIAGSSLKPETVREIIESLLIRVYHAEFGEDKFDICVTQLNEEGFSKLLKIDRQIVSVVSSYTKESSSSISNILGAQRNLGISIHRTGQDELDTIIVVRAPESYTVPRAEIGSIGLFFASILKFLEDSTSERGVCYDQTR